ncbi:MAG TPA: CapA family protein [Pyrinomonadaceae bacterium]|nr:CapA family protein [Pyrinomonadaceae bacterium]
MPDIATILIGGDLCPIEGNRPYFEQGDARNLFNDLLPEFDQAGLVIANLECPLIDKPTPILKTGPVFGPPSACINGIKQAGIDVLCLANNHILDHGAPGLANTLAVCANAGIATLGAGENLPAARRILIREVRGRRIAILALAEHEFSIATKNSWGANPLDLIDYVRNVNSNRSNYDYLIVLLHGGDEFHVPSPRLQDTCRFMVEMGANAVIVQHPHCLGGYEQYRGGHIVYGQGALIMDEPIYRNLKSFHEGFLVKLTIADDPPSIMETVPYVQSASAPGARKVVGAEEQQFRRALQERANAIGDEGFVLRQWLEFCDTNKHGYLSCLLGHNRVLQKLNKAGFIEKFLHGKRPLLGARNIVSCETHREVIETIFNHQLI